MLSKQYQVQVLWNEKKKPDRLQVRIRKKSCSVLRFDRKKNQEIKYIRFYQRERMSYSRIWAAVRLFLILIWLCIYLTFAFNKNQKVLGGPPQKKFWFWFWRRERRRWAALDLTIGGGSTGSPVPASRIFSICNTVGHITGFLVGLFFVWKTHRLINELDKWTMTLNLDGTSN